MYFFWLLRVRYLWARSCLWSQELLYHAVLFSVLSWANHRLNLQCYLFTPCLISRLYWIMVFPLFSQTCGTTNVYSSCSTNSTQAVKKFRSDKKHSLGSRSAGRVIKDYPGLNRLDSFWVIRKKKKIEVVTFFVKEVVVVCPVSVTLWNVTDSKQDFFVVS